MVYFSPCKRMFGFICLKCGKLSFVEDPFREDVVCQYCGTKYRVHDLLLIESLALMLEGAIKESSFLKIIRDIVIIEIMSGLSWESREALMREYDFLVVPEDDDDDY